MPAIIFSAVIGFCMLIMALSSAYIVNEGNVAVITNMGQAVTQEDPNGLQFKTPIIVGVREFDVRERSLPLTLTGATSNQLTTTVSLSVNWRPDRTKILEIFKQYGSPNEFANQIIVPRLTQSAKATIGTFTGVELTTRRNEVAEAIAENARQIFDGYPAIVSSVQFEDFSLPERYWEQVIIREERREQVEQTRLNLEQQQLEAQRDVQTAEAARDASRARADGEAYRIETEAAAQAKATILTAEADAEAIRLRGLAEAEALEAQASALENNPELTALRWAEGWNGEMPRWMMGSGGANPAMMLNLPAGALQ